MGDDYFPSAFEDLWLQEDCYASRAQALDYFCPNLEQGISALLEEISSTDSELPNHNNTQVLNHDRLQEPSDVVVVDDVSNDPKRLFVGDDKETSPFKKSDTPGRDSDVFSGQVREKRKEICGKKRSLFEVEEEEPVVVKKQEHNAKERMRRLKLHQTYLSLASLLPISTTSKKRSTAPVIIDKALDYIPELESEIQELVLKKSNIISAIEKEKLMTITRNNKMDSKASEALTVSVNEVRQSELIFQICMKSNGDDGDDDNIGALAVFSNLIQTFEDLRTQIVSVSTLCICDERECYTIHIQMSETSSSTDDHGRDYVMRLKEKIISSLS